MADETEDVENVPPPRPSISPISLQRAQQNNVQNKITHNDADECKEKNEPTELAFDEIRTTTYPAEDPSTTTVHVTEQSTVTTTTTTITQDDDMIFSPVTIKKQKKQVEKIRMKRKQEEDQKRVVKRIRKGKKKKTGKKRSKDLEVQSSCPICFDEWTNMGMHRIVSLKCGHLFGMSCLQRCLKARKQCPQCNEPAKKRDMRPLFCSKIVAKDMSGQKYLSRKLDEERKARLKAEAEKQEILMELEILCKNYDTLKASYDEKDNLKMTPVNNAMSSTIGASLADEIFADLSFINDVEDVQETMDEDEEMVKEKAFPRFELKENVSVSNARVAVIAERSRVLIVSQQINNTSKKTHSVVKISLNDTKHRKVIPVHTDCVRDVKVRDDMLLTCSVDSTLRVTDLRTDNPVLTYKDSKAGIWACEWSPRDDNVCYAGLQTGQVMKYDLRNTSRALNSFSLGRRQPIHSLRECREGILVGKVGGVEFWKQQENLDDEYYILEENEMLRGSCTSVDLLIGEDDSLIGLAAMRGETARCVLFELNRNKNRLEIKRSLSGHQSRRVLARAVLFDTFALACDESANRAVVWNLSCHKDDACIPLHTHPTPVLDVCSSQNLVFSLSKDLVHIYSMA